MKITLTAPTGKIASQAIPQLLDAGHELTLICREPQKVKAFTDRGAKALQGDLEDADVVRRATEGADAVFLLSPPKYDADDFRAYQNRVGDNFAAAVRANRLKRVVFLSSVGAHLPGGTGPIAGLHDIEAKLNAAASEVGGSVMHVRPSAFYENWFMNIPTVKEHGAVFMPISADAKLPRIATSDIARFVADALTDTSWQGVAVRELSGPQDLSEAECCEIVGKAIGKSINFVPVSPEQAIEAMVGMGLGREIAGKYAEMYQAFEKGVIKPESKPATVPVTFAQFAEAALAPALKA